MPSLVICIIKTIFRNNAFHFINYARELRKAELGGKLNEASPSSHDVEVRNKIFERRFLGMAIAVWRRPSEHRNNLMT